MFSSELKNIDISGVVGTLHFSVSNNGIQLFSADFVPDDKGEITIYDVAGIVEEYIDEAFSDFSFSLGDETVNVRVFRCSIRLSEPAEDFLPSFFLTTLMTDKVTHPDRCETLSFYAQEQCNVFAELSYYVDGNIVLSEVELLAEGSVAIGAVNVVDVSPKLFLDNERGVPVSYTVRAGERSFVFRVDKTLPAGSPILFRNSFGAWETVYMTGTLDTEYEIKRSNAYINGLFRQYEIEDTELYKMNSGILLGSMIRLGMDVARSRALFLMDGGVAGDEIVLVDSELKYSNDDDALPTFTYTYRRALPIAMMKTLRPPKLFDKTFDYTFD